MLEDFPKFLERLFPPTGISTFSLTANKQTNIPFVPSCKMSVKLYDLN